MPAPPVGVGSRCWRISQAGDPDAQTNNYADDQADGPREINIIKSAECNRFARLLPAELVEDPPREQSEKDRPENNGNGGSKTCHETVENYSHYFWGAVTRCIHSSVSIRANPKISLDATPTPSARRAGLAHQRRN